MSSGTMRIAVSNVGGIDETEVTLDPGVTVLAGRNATNRTSFLQAVMAAFGSDRATLKADADEGSVELTLDGTTYTRTLERAGSGVTFGGDPYLDDADVADLFAFLLESNEARLAVARADDLRDIIMRPVDTDAIQSKIAELESDKRDIDAELEEVRSLRDRVPRLQERVNEREQEIEQKEEALAETERELDRLDRDVDETRREKSELEDTFEDISAARQELQNLQYRLETEQESIESLRSERESLDDEWDELEAASESRLEELTTEIQRLREEKQALESESATLQRVIQFNEDMLEGASADIAAALRADGGADDSSPVTDQLLADDTVVCWTCGSAVEESSVEATLERLQSLLREKHGEIRELERDIDDLTSERASLESQRQRAEEVSRRRDRIDNEIEQREAKIRTLRERIDEQSDRIRELESTAESLQDDEYSEVLETHRRANELEFELDRLRSELTELEAELDDVQDRIDDIDELERRREAVTEELREYRTKIDQLEADSVEAFNDHMATILDVLQYENIERIWLERVERQVREGRGTRTQSAFDLHVVRSTPDGMAYEDTVDHLSESEREVTGLIFALAGYLVHDVHDVLPVMVLDSLEAIDSDRIAALIDHFETYADYLVVALLPEDASAVDETHAFVEGGPAPS